MSLTQKILAWIRVISLICLIALTLWENFKPPKQNYLVWMIVILCRFLNFVIKLCDLYNARCETLSVLIKRDLLLSEACRLNVSEDLKEALLQAHKKTRNQIESLTILVSINFIGDVSKVTI